MLDSEFESLLKVVDQLTDEQKRILSARLAEDNQPKKPRTANLGAGTVWMSDDFDDPLPDEFWFGDDA